MAAEHGEIGPVCPICHERVMNEAATGSPHVHHAEDILSAERLATLAGNQDGTR